MMNLQFETRINALSVINSNVEYAIQATNNVFRNKVFVVVNGDYIASFNKTKRGAESYIKKNTFSYYDDYTQDMVKAGVNLVIEEISAFDIVDYYNTKEIWFETILSKWRRRQSNDYTLQQARKIECSGEVIEFIELVLSHVTGHSFPSREMVGLVEIEVTENEVTETIEEVTPETVVNEVVEAITEQKEITYKLNNEKNGVEIYFAEKPNAETLELLKSSGFRWSRFNKCWYAKQSETTLSLAEKLAGGNVSEIKNVSAEMVETELAEFVDILNFKISEETEKRLIDNSLFGDRRTVGRETNELQTTLLNLLDDTKQVIELTDITYNKNKLINGFNSFCERYTREMSSYLYQRSINPSWAVTGRGGLNVDRYNKKQDALFNKMGKCVEMLDKQRSILNKYKNRFKSEKEYKTKQAIQSTVDNLDGVTLSFETRKREIEYYGYNYNTRSYESPNYFMMKLAACYRIFERSTGKEIHSMKTSDKLTDAKKHVLYLEHMKINETA